MRRMILPLMLLRVAWKGGIMLRRRLLILQCVGIAAVSACSTLSYVSQAPVVATDAFEIREDSSVAVFLDRVPSLDTVGGSATLEDDRLPQFIIIARPAAGEYVAASSLCTHRERALGYVHERRVFLCSSMGKSEFALDGSALKGPAEDPLLVYKTTLEGNVLEIQLSR